MESTVTRIKQYIDYRGISVRKFEESVGFSNGAFASQYKSNRTIGVDKVENILHTYKELNPEWLLTGEGSMIKTPLKAVSKPVKQHIEASDDITKTDPETIITPIKNFKKLGCPYYNVDFSAGFDSVFNDQTVNPDYYIDFAPYNRKNAVWCNVSGHSMSPEISNGDIILLRQLQDWQHYIVYGEIYGIITDNSLRTIKRVRKGASAADFLLVPTNKEYDSQEIAKTHITSVFEVLCSVKKF